MESDTGAALRAVFSRQSRPGAAVSIGKPSGLLRYPSSKACNPNKMKVVAVTLALLATGANALSDRELMVEVSRDSLEQTDSIPRHVT